MLHRDALRLSRRTRGVDDISGRVRLIGDRRKAAPIYRRTIEIVDALRGLMLQELSGQRARIVAALDSGEADVAPYVDGYRAILRGLVGAEALELERAAAAELLSPEVLGC